MSEEEKINDLEQLVAAHLDKCEKIVKYETTSLTAPGENYGSLMLSLKLTVKNEKLHNERVLETIAKLIPRNEFVQKVFNVQKTFKNEIGFYGVIVPTLENFLKQSGLDANVGFAAKFFGGRLNLSGEDGKIDSDAILVLENLKVQGYATGNRLARFDADTTKTILRTLAKFHAISLALKIKHPKTFEEKIKPYLTDFIVSEVFEKGAEFQARYALEGHPEGSKYVEVAIRTLKKNVDKTVDEKWATILHNDLWVNNIMIKPIENGMISEDVKLVDFQVCEYQSCLRDLLFFLFSSVRLQVLERHLDEFFDFFYETFTDNLKKFNVDVSGYSRHEYDTQLKVDAKKSAYFQIIHMLHLVLTEAKPPSLDEINPEFLKTFEPVLSQTHKDSILYMTKEFVKRGWI